MLKQDYEERQEIVMGLHEQMAVLKDEYQKLCEINQEFKQRGRK